MSAPESPAPPCQHCGHEPLGPNQGHACPCPYPDATCPDHPAAEPRCCCGTYAMVYGEVPDPGCPCHGEPESRAAGC